MVSIRDPAVAPVQTKDEIGALMGCTIAAHKAFSAYDITYNFPLYLYPEEGTLDQSVRVNFEPKLYDRIREAADLTFRVCRGGHAVRRWA